MKFRVGSVLIPMFGDRVSGRREVVQRHSDNLDVGVDARHSQDAVCVQNADLSTLARGRGREDWRAVAVRR